MTDFYDELRDENAMLSALNDAQAATIRDMGQDNRALEAENARLVDDLEVAYKAVNEAACLSNPDYKEARAGPVITLDLIHQRVQDAVGGMLRRRAEAVKAPEYVIAVAAPKSIFVRFANDGMRIRKWDFKPFDGATEYSAEQAEIYSDLWAHANIMALKLRDIQNTEGLNDDEERVLREFQEFRVLKGGRFRTYLIDAGKGEG